MDFLTAAAAAASPSYSASASSGGDAAAIIHSNGAVGRRGRERERSVVSRTTQRLVRAIVAFVFATVGAFVGAVTGALIGLATESGLFRGAGIGAISGAVYSLDVVESSIRIWHSNESGLRTVLYVVGVFSSLLSGRLVREKVGPAVQNAVQSQMSAINSPFIEVIDIFETGGTGGMSSDSVNKLPKIKITTKNMVDDSGEKICCSVCLQDFQVGEKARSLPHCHHIFHLPCIDNWLVRHGSCPLCRRDI